MIDRGRGSLIEKIYINNRVPKPSEFLSLPRKLFFRDFVLSLTAFLTLTATQPPLRIPYFWPSPHLSSFPFCFYLFLLISHSSISSYDFFPLVSLYKLSPLALSRSSPQPYSQSLFLFFMISLFLFLGRSRFLSFHSLPFSKFSPILPLLPLPNSSAFAFSL